MSGAITMSRPDRSDTITKGFGAVLRRPRPAGEPIAVMAAPRPWRQTVLRFATRRRRMTDVVRAGADDAPVKNERLPLDAARHASPVDRSPEPKQVRSNRMRRRSN